MKPLVTFVMFFLAVTIANAENSVILAQQNPPLTITNYQAEYQSESRGSYSSHSDQIVHTVKFKNVSKMAIVALQIGLVSFDAFNNFMARTNGWAITTIGMDEESSGAWAQSPYAAFSFEKYGTGVAFINAVRFSDGSIWQANPNEVLIELQKFEKDLKKEDLQEKKK